MSLWVNERPPLRLSVSITTPAGLTSRWGTDDPHSRNVPNAMSFGTAMPGGFEQFSCTLERDPRRDYADLESFSQLTVVDPGGQVAWQGRLDALPDTSGDEAQVQPQASGYQAHLQDDDSAAMIYVDQDIGNWTDPPLARQIALVQNNLQQGSYSSGWDSANNPPVPALVQEIDDSWASPWTPVVETWYDSGCAQPIASIYYDFSTQGYSSGSLSLSNWGAEVWVTNDPAAATIETSGNVIGTTMPTVFTPTTAERYGVVHVHYSVTGAGTQGGKYIGYWQGLTVYGNHGLTLYSTGASPSPPGLLASDVIGHAVNTWCPLISFTTGANGSIQPSSFVIPQLVFNTPTTAAQIIQQASAFELLDWAVWEGPTMYANPRPAVGSVAGLNRLWQARSGPAQLQNAGTEASRIYNGVIVSFTDVSGITLTVGPPTSNADYTDPSLVDTDPENPANQLGINRWALVQAGTSTTQGATAIGEIFLTVQKEIDSSGQAMLSGHVQDSCGVWWPAWMVRAGDQISFVDASDTSYRRIVSTSYDDSSKQNTVQLDQPPDTMTALLERLSIVLSSAGLS